MLSMLLGLIQNRLDLLQKRYSGVQESDSVMDSESVSRRTSLLGRLSECAKHLSRWILRVGGE